MKGIELPASPLSEEERLQMAQHAFEKYKSRCFWFLRDDLKVTHNNLPDIVEGLKLHGGHSGWRLAHALCR